MALAQIYQFPMEEATPKVASTRRPSFQFYPGDWRRDPSLNACSLAARGLWMEMLCIAHESDRYGHLSINGRAMTVEQIARIVGESPTFLKKILKELEEAGVFSRTADGTIYSRRMVKDEAVRNMRASHGHKGAEHGHKGKSAGYLGAEHGKKGGRPRKQIPPHADANNPPLNEQKTPAPSSSSSSSISSVPIGTAAVPQLQQAPSTKSPEEQAKQELWRSAVALLGGQGIDEQQARTLMGKLVRDHGNDTVLDAVREAVVTQPADARAWLVKACAGSGTRPAGKRTPKAENFAEKDYGNGVEAV